MCASLCVSVCAAHSVHTDLHLSCTSQLHPLALLRRCRVPVRASVLIIMHRQRARRQEAWVHRTDGEHPPLQLASTEGPRTVQIESEQNTGRFGCHDRVEGRLRAA